MALSPVLAAFLATMVREEKVEASLFPPLVLLAIRPMMGYHAHSQGAG